MTTTPPAHGERWEGDPHIVFRPAKNDFTLSTCPLLDGQRERAQRLPVQVVGRFVHDQQVRVAPHGGRQHQLDLGELGKGRRQTLPLSLQRCQLLAFWPPDSPRMLLCVANSGSSPKSLRKSSIEAIVRGLVASPTCVQQKDRMESGKAKERISNKPPVNASISETNSRSVRAPFAPKRACRRTR